MDLVETLEGLNLYLWRKCFIILLTQLKELRLYVHKIPNITATIIVSARKPRGYFEIPLEISRIINSN